ncbi:protein trichome birefringence-like 19 [Canna indica]|uniref:Protein trichome birefringence-like 19 n=1 Tax=Canna indica TaxID=4628 RepID=A0AAQ3QIC1_9LILI|nr:protein trichome birefringence-like 19 [Canna indica]
MKYGRPDKEFLRWRWNPAACELLRFDAAWFLEVIRGKSMAFIGDSLARNHMQSLIHLQHHGRGLQAHALQPIVLYNFTLSIFWSPFLVKAAESDADGPNHTGLWDLFLDEPDDRWAPHVAAFDYLIISGGNWFTRPALFYEKKTLVGCHYCLRPNVSDLTLRYSHLSLSHFENGEWNKGGDCVRRRPFRARERRVDGLELEMYEVQVEEFRETERRGRGRLMDVTTAIVLRADGHPSRYGHWEHAEVTL